MTDHVYRIQDDEGRGPWKPGFSHMWVEPREDHENLPPWFQEFGRVDKNMFTWEFAGSGCRTLVQLRRWFTKREYKRLKKHGYRCVRLDVSRFLAESDIQCVFTRTKPLNEGIQNVNLY